MYYLYKDETYDTGLPYIIVSDNDYRSKWSTTVQNALTTLHKYQFSDTYVQVKRNKLTLIETFDEHSHPEYFI